MTSLFLSIHTLSPSLSLSLSYHTHSNTELNMMVVDTSRLIHRFTSMVLYEENNNLHRWWSYKCEVCLSSFNIALLNGLRIFDDYIFKAVAVLRHDYNQYDFPVGRDLIEALSKNSFQ